MHIVKAGIHYLAEGSNGHTTELVFCHKGEDGVFIDGLTNEEVIDVMINRFFHLTQKSNSQENIQCLLFARQIKEQLSLRNKNKLKHRADDNSRNGLPVEAAGRKD